MRSSFHHLFKNWLASVSLVIVTTAVTALETETIRLEDYIPISKDNYWSFIGEVKTDDFSTEVNLRREVDGYVPIENRKTFRSTQEVIPSLSDSLDEISFLNKKIFETSQNGWLIFREEYDGQVLQYNRPAKVMPLQPDIEKSFKYKTSLKSESGSSGVVSYHTVLVGKESIDLLNGSFDAIKINQEKKLKITSDEEQENVSSVTTEYNSYWFVKGIGLAKQESNITTVTDSESESVDLSFELVATDYLPNYLWPDAEETPEGWKNVNWFGNVTDNYFPWIYHADHGWLFVDAKDTKEIKLWSESLGWWLTSEELYPTIFSLDLNDWVTYQENESIVREFMRTDGTIIKASNAGFTYRPTASKPQASEIDSQTEKDGNQSFVDAQGNRYTNTSNGLTPDQGELPVIELISPFEGTILEKDEKLLLFADAYDKDGKIKHVKFYVNGSMVHFDEKSPYQFIFENNSDDEELNIHAVAEDNYGNTTKSNSVTVKVDVTKNPPKVRIQSPLNKMVYKSGTKVYVDVVASDIDGFIESVALMVDGIQVGSEIKNGPYRFSFIPPIDGTYQISAIAIDDDENETESSKISVTVNETGKPASAEMYFPEIRIISPYNKETFNAGDSVSIEAYASDDDGSIDRVQIFVDGVQVGSTLNSPPYKVSYTPPLKGSYTVTAKARDNDRNESVSTAITFTVE